MKVLKLIPAVELNGANSFNSRTAPTGKVLAALDIQFLMVADVTYEPLVCCRVSSYLHPNSCSSHCLMALLVFCFGNTEYE